MPTFDIFRGASDKDAVWVEAASRLPSAQQRMEIIAAAMPGRYFVFGQKSNAILARIDTREFGLPSLQGKANSALPANH